VRHAGRHSPKMSQIVLVLQGAMPLEELNGGVRPGHGAAFGSGSGSSGSAGPDMQLIRGLNMALEEVCSLG
jgi:hypothetical protein